MKTYSVDPAAAEAQILERLKHHPEGLPTMALIDHLARRGIAPSDALEVVWRLRDAQRLEMRMGRVVLSEREHSL